MPVDASQGRRQTTPALVQRLGQIGAAHLRREFESQELVGLRPAHALVLVPLLGGGRHASDLAESIGVTRQAIAQVVTGLEADGYVERVSDPGDGRAKLICLTAKGRAALRIMRTCAVELEQTWRDALGNDRLDQLRQLLQTIISASETPE